MTYEWVGAEWHVLHRQLRAVAQVNRLKALGLDKENFDYVVFDRVEVKSVYRIEVVDKE